MFPSSPYLMFLKHRINTMFAIFKPVPRLILLRQMLIVLTNGNTNLSILSMLWNWCHIMWKQYQNCLDSWSVTALVMFPCLQCPFSWLAWNQIAHATLVVVVTSEVCDDCLGRRYCKLFHQWILMDSLDFGHPQQKKYCCVLFMSLNMYR